MTEDHMSLLKDVGENLSHRGIFSTLEYPGYLSVPVYWMHLNCGFVWCNELAGELVSPGYVVKETFVSTLTKESGIEAIADYIADHFERIHDRGVKWKNFPTTEQ